MTAVPYNVSAAIHKMGIPLYFFGVVILQTMIGIKERSLKSIPKILPLMCFLLVVVFFLFAILVGCYERGIVSRDTPVIWEWLAFFFSIIWVLTQSILLGKKGYCLIISNQSLHRIAGPWPAPGEFFVVPYE